MIDPLQECLRHDNGPSTDRSGYRHPFRKPVIRGTRLAVEFIIGLMAEGWSEGDILAEYPGITHDDVVACLRYARDVLGSERVFPDAA